MSTEQANQTLTELHNTVSELKTLFSSLDEKQINQVPYPGSRTAAQLLRHVIKATEGAARSMQKKTPEAQRAPGEKIDSFKSTLLDYTTKMRSPGFIIPEDGHYNKEKSIQELTDAFESLKVNARQTGMKQIVQGLPMGDVTKLELLHFALYHTQRHTEQMGRICMALNK